MSVTTYNDGKEKRQSWEARYVYQEPRPFPIDSVAAVSVIGYGATEDEALTNLRRAVSDLCVAMQNEVGT